MSWLSESGLENPLLGGGTPGPWAGPLGLTNPLLGGGKGSQYPALLQALLGARQQQPSKYFGTTSSPMGPTGSAPGGLF